MLGLGRHGQGIAGLSAQGENDAVPSRSSLRGGNGVVSYQVPASSVTVVTVRGR